MSCTLWIWETESSRAPSAYPTSMVKKGEAWGLRTQSRV